MDVYLNGQFIAAEQARISIDDPGFTHAIGLFETMAAVHGRVFQLGAHIRRLMESAEALGLSRSLDAEELEQAVQQTVTHNQMDRARVRLTVTPGVPSPSPVGAGRSTIPTILVVVTEPVVFDPAYFDRGITVKVVGPGVAASPFDPMAGHKTLAYWPRLAALRQAAGAGAGEAIWLNVTNHLASGSVSNIFLVKGGKLFTPIARGEEVEGALRAPVLPGITRGLVIDLAQRQRIEGVRKMLSVSDLLEADEVFLTNSSWHVLPVTRVEKKVIGDETIGPMTRQLRLGILQLIEDQTGGEV